MIVYGDPQHRRRLSALVRQLHERAIRTPPRSLDALRALLIQAGQLEQAILDFCPVTAGECSPLTRTVVQLTEAAARAFFALWTESNRFGATVAKVERCELSRAMAQLREALPREDPVLIVKIPEGFEFYALYPEQYCAAALKWCEERKWAGAKTAMVLGIRSIGTTLSALVKAVLERAGWWAERITVRPTGHPFARRVDVPAGRARPRCACALVVDEGPGLSGSSMAAAAQALAELGYADIAFFPGNGNDPGSAASAMTRKWWARTPRYFVPLQELVWQGESLNGLLLEKTRCFLRAANSDWVTGGDGATSLEPELDLLDVSAGHWRAHAFAREEEWPAACLAFERVKFLAGPRNRQSILWRFNGLGSSLGYGPTFGEEAFARLERLSEEGLTPKPLGMAHGFLAMEWVPGCRLSRAPRPEAAVLARLANYIARSAQPPMPPREVSEAIGRLAEMLTHNVSEALGEHWVDRTRIWAEEALRAHIAPTYGDGRMGPWEWVKTVTGHLIKTDACGHELDHTIIGKQSVLWDVAGTIVEWGLSSVAEAEFCRFLGGQGIKVQGGPLRFHMMAYAAFRLGMISLEADRPNHEGEARRLESAKKFYTRRVKALLQGNLGGGSRKRKVELLKPHRPIVNLEAGDRGRTDLQAE